MPQNASSVAIVGVHTAKNELLICARTDQNELYIVFIKEFLRKTALIFKKWTRASYGQFNSPFYARAHTS